MLVLDANVVLAAAAAQDGFDLFGKEDLVAPPLLWPEVRSVLHVSVWRKVISAEVASRSLTALESGRVRERRHRRLGAEAWRIADDLGWAKTYDAEYLALALLLGGKIATFDRRLRRAAEHLGIGIDLLAGSA